MRPVARPAHSVRSCAVGTLCVPRIAASAADESRATDASAGDISQRDAGVAYALTENEPASDCQIPPPPARRPARSSRYNSVAERTASPTSRGKARPTSGAGSASASPISCSGTGRPSLAPIAAAMRWGAAPCGTMPLETHLATEVLS